MTLSFSLLSVANLAAGTPITGVPAIFASMRLLAQKEGLTGLMVFDGAGFCLYLEGPREAVLRCHDAGLLDSRQAELEEVYHGRSEARRYAGFASGYALADGLPASEQLRALDGEAALQKFLQLAADFDLGFF